MGQVDDCPRGCRKEVLSISLTFRDARKGTLAHRNADSIGWRPHPGGPALDFQPCPRSFGDDVDTQAKPYELDRLTHPTLCKQLSTQLHDCRMGQVDDCPRGCRKEVLSISLTFRDARKGTLAHRNADSIGWRPHPGGPALDFQPCPRSFGDDVDTQAKPYELDRLTHPTLCKQLSTQLQFVVLGDHLRVVFVVRDVQDVLLRLHSGPGLDDPP